jgi:hypothetical protein
LVYFHGGYLSFRPLNVVDWQVSNPGRQGRMLRDTALGPSDEFSENIRIRLARPWARGKAATVLILFASGPGEPILVPGLAEHGPC